MSFKQKHRVPTEQHQAILNEYCGGETLYHVTRKYNTSRAFVKKLLNEAGLDLRSYDFFAHGEEKRKKAIELYSKGYTSRQITKEIQVSTSTIWKWLKREGIDIRSKQGIAGDKMEKRGFIHISTSLYAGWKKNAQIRNLVWDMTPFDIEKQYQIQNGRCFYSNVKMLCSNSDVILDNFKERSKLISLDRLDSSKGYSKDNVVLCCVSMNLAKRDFSKDEFISFLNELIQEKTVYHTHPNNSIPAHFGLLEGLT